MVGKIVICNSGWLYNEEIHDNDWTIALFTIPLGLALIFSKEKYWMDDYFFECEAEEYELEYELEDCYEYDDYDEVFMSDILIAAFQEFKKVLQIAKYYISKCKISRPVS